MHSINSISVYVDVCETMPSIENSIIVPPFVIHNSSCNEFILYLISLDLHINFLKHLTPVDARFVEIQSLQIYIHDGPYKSIKYKAVSGLGYRLPLIKNYFASA
ncbi:Ac146-like protein [Oryctes rhinoceros nudivirus]|uniref:Ac146-like protein n=1 Tax=Oryctes rhinoceros nudivirus TaxID=92521 RepID=B7SV40_9VIRU|nr:Ac146-like protein [Oryctes rhinoceros nudivirus]ACH96149.1 Ac146-like protein [Oryctes rhinoceros nudivirus]